MFSEKLKEQHLDGLMREVEMPLVKVLAEMEWEGIALDTGRTEKLAGEFADMELMPFIVYLL